MEAEMLLRDANIFPSGEVLQETLGDNIYSVLSSFLETITSEEYNLSIEWKFYNDGKAWLGKITHKKKTILWLSVWNGFFKISFYFTEKHLEAIDELTISEVIKEEFCKMKPVGKLIPMIMNIAHKEQIQDLLTIVCFKMSLK